MDRLSEIFLEWAKGDAWSNVEKFYTDAVRKGTLCFSSLLISHFCLLWHNYFVFLAENSFLCFPATWQKMFSSSSWTICGWGICIGLLLLGVPISNPKRATDQGWNPHSISIGSRVDPLKMKSHFFLREGRPPSRIQAHVYYTANESNYIAW